jgi:UDP-glucose 4-epimerase
MKILIVGASGFVGRNLLLNLKTNDKIVAVYNKSNDFVDFLKMNKLTFVLPVCIDLTKAEELYKILEISSFFDACIYLAANSDPAVSVEKPAYDLITNSVGLINLLENIAFDKFIYFSSGAVYDGLVGPVSPQSKVSPKLPYAISKLASERYLSYYHKSGTVKQLILVRFFGAYGPYEPPRKIYTRLVKRFGIEKNPNFTIRGDGKNLINAMYIDDAINAISILLTKEDESYVLFDLHADNSMTITELVNAAAEIFNINAIINYEKTVPEYIQFYSIDSYMYDRFNFKASISLRQGLLNLYNHVRSIMLYNHEDKKLYREILSSN